MRKVCIVTPCFNEIGNIRELYTRIRATTAQIPQYEFEILFIDNRSMDGTVEALRQLAAIDPKVKVILNARNFGHIRSPHHALLQASGDAVIGIASDLQDPPEMIPEMIRRWEAGSLMVLGMKTSSDESRVMYWVRTRYYRLIKRLSEMETLEHVTGFGLYDRKVIEIMRAFDDAYPYSRGMISEIGLPYATLEYHQPTRSHGFTKNNFYTLYDMAMLGITNVSKVPLRLMTGFGFACALLSILVSFGYLVYKLLFWNSFSVGIAPIAIGLFFFASVQLAFIGILGEYVAATHTQVLKRPLVIEAERINFGGSPRAENPGGIDALAKQLTLSNETETVVAASPGRASH
jgi:glycosyltransferase involved in cell wall biosynthesis